MKPDLRADDARRKIAGELAARVPHSLFALLIEQLVLKQDAAIWSADSFGRDRLADVARYKEVRDQVDHLQDAGRPVARDEKKSRLIFGVVRPRLGIKVDQ